jgi:lipopolysaccharide export LptBFGC system permease protein LptF
MDGHDDTDVRGRRWLRVLVWLLVTALAVVVLFTWVFPWVESFQQDPRIEAQASLEPR